MTNIRTQRHINSIFFLPAWNTNTLRLELPGEKLEQTECGLRIYAEEVMWGSSGCVIYQHKLAI